jgi:ribosome-associated heat shock protein Hsp15
MPRNPEPASQSRTRLDKWLWASRFYKTRSLAAQAIESGQVRIGDERVKSAHGVHVGDRIVVRRGGLAWDVGVTALSDRRGSAADAARLYVETQESAAARVEEVARRKAVAATEPVWPGRPTKRDRRKLREFLDEA